MKTFKQAMSKGKHLNGTFIQTGHPAISELVGKLGFDFILIDTEHSAICIETVQAMLQSVSSTPAFGLVRIPAISTENISRTLDTGADAIVIPQVRDIEDMEVIENASLYPPQGKRGIGPGRASGYGISLMDKKDSPNKDTSIIIQIETKEALANLESILCYDFYDMIFIGPGDLSMNLGVFGENESALLIEKINMIISEARKHSKKVGVFAGNVKDANHWISQGVDFCVLNSEVGLMTEYIQSVLKQLD